MQCVSLFSGAGGIDQGMRAAGFDVLCSVEADFDCCATLRANGFRRVDHTDIAVWPRPNIARGDQPLVVVGGPPCQPFSKSAYWSRTSAQGLADTRANSLELYVAVVRELRPDAFIIENVEGFVTSGGVTFLEEKLAELRRLGLHYSFTWKVLNCADYGVPQKRRRFFGVGTLKPGFEFPRPTHGPHLRPHLTAWDALHRYRAPRHEDLAPRGPWADLLSSIPEGRNYLWHTSRGGGVELFGCPSVFERTDYSNVDLCVIRVWKYGRIMCSCTHAVRDQSYHGASPTLSDS